MLRATLLGMAGWLLFAVVTWGFAQVYNNVVYQLAEHNLSAECVNQYTRIGIERKYVLINGPLCSLSDTFYLQ